MTAHIIGIIGAGGMGTGIARRLTAAGHDIVITDTDPATAQRAATGAATSAVDGPGRARAGALDEALAAEIVVLALWYPGTVALATAHREQLAGKIVIDIANPLDASFTGLTLEPTTSAAEELADAVPTAVVVKAFNTVPAPTLLAAAVDGIDLDTFVAADDDTARAAVVDLLAGSGLRGLDAGKLRNSRLLERLTAFGIELAQRYGLGFDFGFKYLPPRTLTLPVD